MIPASSFSCEQSGACMGRKLPSFHRTIPVRWTGSGNTWQHFGLYRPDRTRRQALQLPTMSLYVLTQGWSDRTHATYPRECCQISVWDLRERLLHSLALLRSSCSPYGCQTICLPHLQETLHENKLSYSACLQVSSRRCAQVVPFLRPTLCSVLLTC